MDDSANLVNWNTNTVGSNPTLGSMKNIAVILTMEKYGTPHLETFKKNNPKIPIEIYNSVPNPIGNKGWRNCDRNIKDWWHETGKTTDFEFVTFMEWDVYFNEKLEKIFPGEEDFIIKNHIERGSGWHWFNETIRLPGKYFPYITGGGPLCLLRISKKCLQKIFSTKSVDILYGKDIFCELRLPTLISSEGFKITEADTIPYVDWRYTPEPKGKGVWHPIKTKK